MAKSTVNLLILALVSAAVVSLQSDQCSRYSPSEIWYSDFGPWLNSSLLEFTVLFRIVFDRVEDNLFLLMPHIPPDSDKAGNITSSLHAARDLMASTCDEVYKEIERSWLRLIQVSDALMSSGKSDAAAMFVSHRMGTVAQTLKKQNDHLNSTLKDVMLFFEGLVAEAIEGLTYTLENEFDEDVDEVPESQGDVVKALYELAIKKAPEDYLAGVVSRILGRALGNNKRYKTEPLLLIDAIERVKKMIDEYEEFFKENPIEPESWTQFWTNQFEQSLNITNKRQLEGVNEYEHMFTINKFYTVEVMTNLITFYSQVV